jgi:uncharacterized protein YdeI (BOF family)
MRNPQLILYLVLAWLVFVNIHIRAEELQPLSYPTNDYKIQISELYPNINTGESEWIEIYNYGDKDLNLSQFSFSDKDCNQTGKILTNKIINAHSHAFFEKVDTNISLNDSGDNILLCATNKEISRFEYKSSQKGFSISRKFENAQYSDSANLVEDITEPSPGQKNKFQVEEIVFISIADARELENGQEVIIKGVVTIENNQLYENTIYIQDATGGIKVSIGDSVNLMPKGSTISFKGTMSESANQRKVNLKEIIEIQESGVVINYQTINSELEAFEGMLVQVEGEIIKNYSTSFDIDTPNGLIRVSKVSTFNFPEHKVGDISKTKGLLIQDKDIYRLIVSNPTDIEIITQSKADIETEEVKQSVSKIESKEDILGINTQNSQITINYKLPSTKVINLNLSEQVEEIYIWPFILLLLAMIITVIIISQMSLNFSKVFKSKVELGADLINSWRVDLVS